MKYKIYEFDIEETIVDNSENRQRNLQLVESFPNELREKLCRITIDVRLRAKKVADVDLLCYS